MGAGVAAAGAVASLAQAGIGAYQAHKAKIAQDRAMQELRNAPKAQNMYDTMRIGNEAYAAQEAKNAQSEANMVQSFQDMGTTAALAGIPAIQQQSEMANADIAAKKAADLQQVEMMKTQQQQKIEEDYLNKQRELGMMELQGAGAARAQGNQEMWGGLGGMTALMGSLAGNEKLMTSWGLGGKKTPPVVTTTTNP
jgi:hypothetical protein